MKTLSSLVILGSLLHTLPGCATDDAAPGDDSEDANTEDQDNSKEDAASTTPTVTTDQLNGQWRVSGAGDDNIIESWSAVGIRLHFGGKVISLSRTGDTLTGDGVSLTAKPNKSGIKDDTLEGTINGATVKLTRDTTTSPTPDDRRRRDRSHVSSARTISIYRVILLR